jgi:hypothetical protein
VKIDPNNRPYIEDYTGIMRPITDSHSSPFGVYATWTGATVPIKGMSEEELAIQSTVGLVQAVAVETPADGIYTLDGRAVGSAPLRPGIYVKVTDGRVRKTVVK